MSYSTDKDNQSDSMDMGRVKDDLPDAHESNPGEAQKLKVGDITGWVKAETYDYTDLQASGEAKRGLWDGSAAVYEAGLDVEGDVGPAIPELELQLFGPVEERAFVQGIDFSKIACIDVFQEGPIKVDQIKKFKDANLHPVTLRNVELSGYDVPTPIQRFTIPAIKQGYDVIGIAQTGSGKTAAYMIPIIDKLVGKAKKLAAPRPNPATYREGIDPPCRAEPLVCIVVPTRELAIQIFNEARKFCYRTMLRPCVCYGGGPVGEQLSILAKGCDILIATPGRLVDFIQRPANLSLRRLRFMVIDEADEMLENDWEEQFNQILTGSDQVDGVVNYMLFSATFPKAARDLARDHLAADHVRFRVGRAGSSHENIKQVILEVGPYEKKQVLVDKLTELPPCRIIVFVNSKRTADELDDFLFNLGLPCTSLHSDRTQMEREAAMRAFRAGKAPILIATGLSARGIDVRNVMHVINYDLPSMDHGGIEEYTHRIGRTGRAGHRGLATSFYTERDEPIASVLTRTLLETKQDIPDFLSAYVPEGDDRENLKFETDSNFDDGDDFGAGAGGGADGWGNPAGDGTDAWGTGGDAAVDAWGTGADSAKADDADAGDGGWGAPAEKVTEDVGAGGGW